jgi:hypothetical protein
MEDNMETLELPVNAYTGFKEVSIRRKNVEQSHLPVAVRNEAITRISSVFGKGRAPLRGLTDEEERRWLPEIIGVSPSDPSWQKVTTAYWADLTIKVTSAGVVLQVGFENGEPINLDQYVKYRFCLAHPHVAPSKDIMLGNPLTKFYIHDPKIESKKENVKVATKRNAYIEFAKITGESLNIDKMKRIVRLMTDASPENYDEVELENTLSTLVDTQPDKFYRFAKDKDLDLKSTIHKLVELDILRKIGNTYIYMDSEVGGTLEEAVIFFKKVENSAIVAEIKAKLKEVSR